LEKASCTDRHVSFLFVYLLETIAGFVFLEERRGEGRLPKISKPDICFMRQMKQNTPFLGDPNLKTMLCFTQIEVPSLSSLESNVFPAKGISVLLMSLLKRPLAIPVCTG